MWAPALPLGFPGDLECFEEGLGVADRGKVDGWSAVGRGVSDVPRVFSLEIGQDGEFGREEESVTPGSVQEERWFVHGHWGVSGGCEDLGCEAYSLPVHFAWRFRVWVNK